MITIGIDPGITGAVGVLINGEYSTVFDIPSIYKGKSTRREINPWGMASLLRDCLDPGHDCEIILEQVNAMPGQGVVSVFSFGDSYGCCRAIAATLKIPTRLVSPAKWKKHFNLDRDKEHSRALAVRLFPDAQMHLKKHADRAEALLMARYLWELSYA